MKNLIPSFIKNLYRRILFSFACIYYGVNIKESKFIGVTGTSGKTTTSSMIYHLLERNGVNVGLISTVGVKMREKNMETGFHVTTPDPIDLVRYIKELQDENVEYIVLEASSHALAQNRIGGIQFKYSVFTNIAEDHLDFHKTWENYARAKAILIDRLEKEGVLIINKDDSRSFKFLKNYIRNKNINVIEYSLDEVSEKKQSIESVTFNYKNNEFNIRILGDYNISNALAAIKVAENFGIEVKKLAKSFSEFKTVQGRMEVFQMNPFMVILDFAHNADSLEKSLETAVKLVKDGGRLISIFGSAGLRDLNKRFEMGRISGEIADITILTAEDPRTEKLFNINSEILRGLESDGAKLVRRFENHKKYLEFLQSFGGSENNIKESIPYIQGVENPIEVEQVYIFDEDTVNSRLDAIDLAMRIADKGDVIITNGKGHERTLAFGSIEYPFSDQKAIKKALGK